MTRLSAQTDELKTVELDTNFNWRNSTLAELDSFYYNLPVVENSQYLTHFRISLSGQTIDFFSRDNESFQGLLTNVITEYRPVKKEWGKSSESSNYVFQKTMINSTLSTNIAKKILQSGQNLIPTDSLIPSWNKWYLHCGSIKFQFKLGENYSEQSFHCPWSQPDTTMSAEVIVSNYELLETELELKKAYDDFQSKLAKGKTYSRNGYMMMYIMTKEQNEAWKKDKPRRDYLKAKKDTIDNYLNLQLDSLQATFDSTDYSCNTSYHLTFAKNGRLKDIWTHPDGKMKIGDGLSRYIEDRIEIRRCYRQIKRIFKKVNLGSFDLEYEVYRTFHFDLGDGWMITDDTIY